MQALGFECIQYDVSTFVSGAVYHNLDEWVGESVRTVPSDRPVLRLYLQT